MGEQKLENLIPKSDLENIQNRAKF